MLVNPNRPDLFGKDISTNEEDGNGKKFREEFLENIKNMESLIQDIHIKT